MSRPKKCRNVCSLPKSSVFVPAGMVTAPAIVMTIDEYEAVRLIDKEGFSQEECSDHMHIARATVQLIYSCARKKIACALVDGCTLKIEGGDYRLCTGTEPSCTCGGCRRHCMNKSANAIPNGE